MAATVNERDKILAAAGTRLETFSIPSNATYDGDVSGNLSGTLNGTAVATIDNGALRANAVFAGTGAVGFGTTIGGVATSGVFNSGITLSSGGSLLGAGGGSITGLDYGNVSGTKPPASATTNFFSRSGSNPSGGVDGDAHYNTSTQTMWFKTSGIWAVGGTVNANQITTGTLAAARIASNSVTTDKLNVGGALSNITTNAGSLTSGTLGGSSNITVDGVARFDGFTSSGLGTASIVCNALGNTSFGVVAFGSSAGVTAQSTGGAGIQGRTNGSGAGVRAITSGSGPALDVIGRSVLGTVSMSTQTISNLTAGAANFVSGSNVSGAVSSASNAIFATSAGTASNSNQLGGVVDSGWCRGIATNVGTATASGFGFGLTSTVTNVRVRASGNNMIIEEFSDENMKSKIKPETLGLDFIMDLEPITYELVETVQVNEDIVVEIPINDVTYHGFGAATTKQKLTAKNKLKKNDCLGRTLPDGAESTSAVAMIGPLVKAVQELTAMIEDLQTEQAKLKIKVDK